MPDFKTMAGDATAEFKDKGSRFIAFAKRVNSREEAETELERIRKSHPKSRHVCYAWVMLNPNEDYRANDDGEPSNSAGFPILGQIRSFQLSFTLVAVVRYFGGTLLGVPGLINAYKSAAQLALESAEFCTESVMESIAFSISFMKLDAVMTKIKRNRYEIISAEFDNNCTFTIQLPADEQRQFLAFLLDNGASIAQ